MTVVSLALGVAVVFAVLGFAEGLLSGTNPFRAAVAAVCAYVVLGGLCGLAYMVAVVIA
jgi:hypothetical protein